MSIKVFCLLKKNIFEKIFLLIVNINNYTNKVVNVKILFLFFF